MSRRLIIAVFVSVTAGAMGIVSDRLAAGSPDRATLAAQGRGWEVFFCKGETEATGVRLRIGVGGDRNSHTDWTTWTTNQAEWLAVPEKYQHVREIWIRGDAQPRDRNVHMCIHYNRESKQKLTFDEGEEHEVSQGDSDDCGC